MEFPFKFGNLNDIFARIFKLIININVSWKNKMGIFYAVAKGNQIGIFVSSIVLKRSVIDYPGSIYDVFDDLEEAQDYLSRFEDSKIDISLKMKTEQECLKSINFRKCFVVYVVTENFRGKEYYGMYVKKKEGDVEFIFETKKSSTKTLTEIDGILSIIERFEEKEITLYTQNIRVVDLYNKFLPQWEKTNWKIKNKSREFELMRILSETIGDRKVQIKKSLNSTLSGIEKSKLMCRKEIIKIKNKEKEVRVHL
jgi:viroplasmin and RNaseH domain-containing protein